MIDIYKITLLNGHKTQISYIHQLKAWLIGVKTNIVILRDKNDLTSIFSNLFHSNTTSKNKEANTQYKSM